MTIDNSQSKRSCFAPEIVQTSAMDCGPATLKCLLEGFGVAVNLGRLREACLTDVDGSSIDVLEETAVQLGLDAEQVMAPADHLLAPGTPHLPAIVVVRQPNGLTHFVVVWRLHGPFVQVMDPASGRRWRTRGGFSSELYIHRHPIPARAWRDWTAGKEFRGPLGRRMAGLGMAPDEIEPLMESALSREGWRPSAALDAAARMVEDIVHAKGLNKGKEAGKALQTFYRRALNDPSGEENVVPRDYWTVQPAPDAPGEERLLLKGVVLLRVHGRREERTAADPREVKKEASPGAPPLSPELTAAIEEKPDRPGRELFRLLREDGLLTPAVLSVALAMASLGVMIEALLFRGLLSIGGDPGFLHQRAGAAMAIVVFLIGLLALEIPISSAILRMGRRLEIRLRIAFLSKLPHLGERYFHGRLTSDMAQRAHEIRWLRQLPRLGLDGVHLFFRIVLTAGGVILFAPQSAWIAVLAVFLVVGVSFAAQPVMAEQDLRLRIHLGVLSRFYLDALLGLVPIRAHCARRAMQREHEGLLVEWRRAGMDLLTSGAVVAAVEALAGAGFSIWILFNYLEEGGSAGGVLLLLYWALNLPALGKTLADLTRQYPMHRSRILRLLEPLQAPAEDQWPRTKNPDEEREPDAETRGEKPGRGVSITLDHVSVTVGGRTILKDIDLAARPGEHIAVVGPSGAGKTSLAGLLLGWRRPTVGRILLDGAAPRGERLRALRRDTAWVDPSVRIWNRTFYENIRFGARKDEASSIMGAIEGADLLDVLQKLPEGLQTTLGEGGGLLSGGEGQRVRLARALLRGGVRLAILDEPFRGLDREKRHELLGRARRRWRDATLIFISHDIAETRAFERVLVMEDGRLKEDGAPDRLAGNPDSRYHAYLRAEETMRREVWENKVWRRLWLENGRLTEGKEATSP